MYVCRAVALEKLRMQYLVVYVVFKVERFRDLVINLTWKISTASFGAHCNTTSLHFIENILVFFYCSACCEFKAEKEFSYKIRSANDKLTH